VEVVASLSQGHTAAAQCGLFAHKSVPVIFEPPCTFGNCKHEVPFSCDTFRNKIFYGEPCEKEVKCPPFLYCNRFHTRVVIKLLHLPFHTTNSQRRINCLQPLRQLQILYWYILHI